MKRIKRKQLKEDEFVSTINKIVRFIKSRIRELIALCVLILFGVIIFLGVRFIKSQSRVKDNRILTQILHLRSELDENPESLTKLEELAGGGKFSHLANLVLATHWVEKEDYDKAQAYLGNIPERPKDIFYYQAQDLLAQIHIKRNDYDKAVEIYKRMERENPEMYSLDVILFHQAEALEKKGQLEEALALYRRVQDEFSQTYYGFDAAQKVKKIEAKS